MNPKNKKITNKLLAAQPAFPHIGMYRGAGGDLHPEPAMFPGMSLRTYIATAAMVGYVQSEDGSEQTGSTIPEEVARIAVKYADALIAELNKTP